MLRRPDQDWMPHATADKQAALAECEGLPDIEGKDALDRDWQCEQVKERENKSNCQHQLCESQNRGNPWQVGFGVG